jgi:cyclophilin family peptidyl-prolyl cis-trans isomerase
MKYVCIAVLALLVILPAVPVPGFAEEEKMDSNPMVLVKTSLGDFTVELYEKEAPISVKNFLSYVDKKFYDGTIFHRIIPTFVLQGGGFTADMMKKATAPPIKNEADNGLKNKKGTLSMARTSDINSATSQFFINLKNNDALDHKDKTTPGYGYAVFGMVVDGWEVCEKIKKVKTTTKGQYKDVPVKPVVIESIRRIEPEKEKGKEKTAEE